MDSPTTYLGDGVYARFDGYYIWLWTSNGVETSQKIAIEPEVFTKLLKFASAQGWKFGRVAKWPTAPTFQTAGNMLGGKMIKRHSRSADDIVDELLKFAYHDGDCLIAHLKPNKKGYIPVQVGGRSGKKWRAHRLIYHTIMEELTDTDLVLHSCDNRACINPAHLYVGTAAQNTADMLERNRAGNQYGTGYGINLAHGRRRSLPYWW